MENKAIAKAFKLCSQLMELFNQNPFRTKAMASASFKLDKLPFPAVDATLEQLSEQPGIGKSTAEKVISLIQTGSFAELDQLIAQTPAGVLDMLGIKGLGPKKIQIIWNDLGIETVGELLYACNENRLVEAKGFGLKTQEEIRKAIEFANAAQGLFLYAKAEKIAQPVLLALEAAFPGEKWEFTGEFRRKCEIISSLDILTTASVTDVAAYLAENEDYSILEEFDASLQFTDSFSLKYQLIFSSPATFAQDLLLSTGSEAHITQLRAIQPDIPNAESEEAIYQALGLDFIAPELREGQQEVAWAQAHTLPALIKYEDLKGTLHNHSTYSDGVHSLEQMANYCKNELGLGYFGICDHSKTAVYASGLSVERLEAQWQEIDQLNAKLAPFKIFKGIESDILGDGSLDYPAAVLAQFDFVVASVHSNLRMDEEKATQRLITAIENPYTTILGHPTGRLLLSRAGYPIDYKKVIDACAANGVAIEINANPLRLDLDWRWQQYALEKGVLLSINPDAHRTEGLHDMQFGIHVARKGGLSADRCLNAFSTEQLAAFFDQRKANIAR
ncbi:helix-hairpin-helix domain-containing protein [Sphingobacterium oryzagri]|uniref:Helix-hairpin-helix domain-containing protein n=1 Tax=Sphingobacterium oryzagri TaxID=3025669 RepID=A0ABY7WNA1_9SPHI|nr:DNA polymerase/3'-5' exonuclease PolX [Sphingobacterium sp. KACC 22765]WDF69896.1 helix-hairpin-helix domain-containing protein [Sphingobacterium sp. KACC 22765]